MVSRPARDIRPTIIRIFVSSFVFVSILSSKKKKLKKLDNYLSRERERERIAIILLFVKN